MLHFLVASNQPVTPPSTTPSLAIQLDTHHTDKLANLLGFFAENGTIGHSIITVIKITCFMAF